MNLTKINQNGSVVFNGESCFAVEEVASGVFALVNHSFGLVLSTWNSREAAREHKDSYLASKKTLRLAIERYNKYFLESP